MSAYANDLRVYTRSANSFDVFVADGSVGQVWRRVDDDRWIARREVDTTQNYDTADEAIRSLIGDPR